MATRHLLVAALAIVVGCVVLAGTAFAQDVRGVAPTTEERDDPNGRDHRASCERLESKIQDLRAALGRLDAYEQRIERAIADGTLTGQQLIRTRHALAKTERLEEALEAQLARALGFHGEHCRR